MEPILNYTPQIYEAIIAALALISVLAIFALRSKHNQTVKLKSTLKTVITEATKAVVTGAMFGSLQVAKARAESRGIAKAAETALAEAETILVEQQERIAELEAEAADSRLDDVEQRLDALEDDGEETSGVRSSSPFADFRFPFESPGPFAGGSHPLDALFASIGRNRSAGPRDPLETLFGGLSAAPGGRASAPTIQAFKITPDGLVPVKGPADFLGGGLASGGTFNRPDPAHRAPSLATILSLLASLPSPRRGSWAGPDADSVKADLAAPPASFLYDEHGPAAPGDDPYAAIAASVGPQPSVEAEACDTQRPPVSNSYESTHTADGDRCPAGDPAALAPSPVAGGAPEPLTNDNEPGARAVPRYARKLPDAFPGFGIPSPRAG